MDTCSPNFKLSVRVGVCVSLGSQFLWRHRLVTFLNVYINLSSAVACAGARFTCVYNVHMYALAVLARRVARAPLTRGRHPEAGLGT